MLRILKNYKKSDFIKNAGTLITGTGLAQSVSLFTAPFLTRIYSPADYGILGLYMSISGLFSAVVTLQYHIAIFTAPGADEAKRVLSACLQLLCIVSGASLLLLLPFRHMAGSFFDNPHIADWLWFLPLSVFFNGWNLVFNTWANRVGSFKLMSLSRICTALLVPMVSISVGLLWKSPGGLVLGLICGQSLPPLFMGLYFIRKRDLQITWSWRNFKTVYYKHKQFRLYTLPTEFINVLVNQLPQLILGRLTNASTVGYYALSNRMLGLPAQVIASSVGEVFRKRAAEDYHKSGSCRPIVLKTTKWLALFSAPFFILLFAFGPQLFNWVFGEQWIIAGEFSRLMMVMFFAQFISSPISYVFFIANKQKEDLYIHLLIILISFGSFYAGHLFFHSAQAMLLLYALGYALIYAVYLILSYYYGLNRAFRKK